MPSRPPPSALAWVSAAIGPPIQRWKKQPATRSPALTRVTPSPTSTTSPAPSESGMTFGFTAMR